MKEDEAFGEMEHLANEPYTIKVKYHEGASRIGSDIHGVMCDLAASETVELKQGEVKIIEPDYCGDGDVWGFVAYAIRDTVIERGTRIAQFMPAPFIPDWNTIIFKEIESMGCADRGGYGSTGERSAGASTAEGRTFRDANGLELHVGDYVIDEFGECFCVMGLNREDGATAAYADLGNSRTSIECAPCKSLELDERPHDCDGVPIEVGDVLYQTTFEGKPIGDPMEVERYTGNALFVKGLALPINAWSCTHREPDSWEKLEEDAKKTACDYADAPLDESGVATCDGCRFHKRKYCYQEMALDVLTRAKRLAGIGEEQR